MISSMMAKIRALKAAAYLNLDAATALENEKSRRVTAAWNAIAPERIAAVRHEANGIRVLHPTKGWRFLSNKRLGLA